MLINSRPMPNAVGPLRDNAISLDSCFCNDQLTTVKEINFLLFVTPKTNHFKEFLSLLHTSVIEIDIGRYMSTYAHVMDIHIL